MLHRNAKFDYNYKNEIKYIHVREYRRVQSKMDNSERIAELGTQDTRRGTNKTKTEHKCAGQHYTQANTNNVNKT